MSIEWLGLYGDHLLYPLNAISRIFSACEGFVGVTHVKLINGDIEYIRPVEMIHAELGRYVIASP